MNKLVSWL